MAAAPKILVVDDDRNLLYAYTRILEYAGYPTLEASTGEDCLRAAARERPALILLDVMLPDMNGFEVCRRIKSDPALVRTLVLHVSGTEISPDSQAYGLESGADGYLTKPVEPKVLIAQVRAFMRLRSAERALVDQQEREMNSLKEISSAGRLTVTARLYGVQPLRESLPEVFDRLVESYVALLDQALDERVYKVERKASEGLQAIVDELGFLRAGPRDVIDIHSVALKKRVAGVTSPKAQAYVEEGRLRILELMGYLAAYYRNHSL
jgi:DNA-binding response OmpR family regulator